MVEFLRVQYKLGRVTAVQLHSLIGKVITAEQCAEILGGAAE